MSYEFLSFNEAGKVTAGSDLSNLYFLRKQTISVGTGGVALPIVPTGGMIFFQTSLPLVIINDTIKLLSMGYYWYGQFVGGFGAGTVTYYIFVRPEDAAIGNSMGLEVYSPDGKLSFSAGKQSMKLEGSVSVTTDDYQIRGSNTRVYIPFTAATGLSAGKSLAFSVGGTRVYWSSTQLINAQTGYLFTDTSRSVRGMRLDDSNNLETSVVVTGTQRFDGLQGNFNYSPNGAMPISALIVDVAGL